MDNFYGDNIRWFMGIVKDLKDPIKMGRVRVRIFGVHSEDQQEIPDDKLPWAQVMAPVTEGGVNNQGCQDKSNGTTETTEEKEPIPIRDLDLPDGWLAYRSNTYDGDIYYFNASTGVCTWDVPTKDNAHQG